MKADPLELLKQNLIAETDYWYIILDPDQKNLGGMFINHKKKYKAFI